MALPSSGTIRLSQIKTEFDGPNNLRSYLRGGTYVPDIIPNSSVPSSGTIKITNFYSSLRPGNEHTLTVGASGSTYGYSLGAGYGSISTQRSTIFSGAITLLNSNPNGDGTFTISLWILGGATIYTQSLFTYMEVVPSAVVLKRLASSASSFTVIGSPGAFTSVWTWGTASGNMFGTTIGTTRKIYFY